MKGIRSKETMPREFALALLIALASMGSAASGRGGEKTQGGQEDADSGKAAPDQAESKRSFVIFTSRPPGAVVGVDGKPIGRTPMADEFVSGKSYRLQVCKKGYKLYTTTIEPLGDRQRLSVLLEPSPAAVQQDCEYLEESEEDEVERSAAGKEEDEDDEKNELCNGRSAQITGVG